MNFKNWFLNTFFTDSFHSEVAGKIFKRNTYQVPLDYALYEYTKMNPETPVYIFKGIIVKTDDFARHVSYVRRIQEGIVERSIPKDKCNDPIDFYLFFGKNQLPDTIIPKIEHSWKYLLTN